MRSPWWILALLLVGGVALAVDTAAPPDTGDTGDTGADSAPESAVFGRDSAFAGPDRRDTTDSPVDSPAETGDTGLDEKPCSERGLWAGDITFTTQAALDRWAQDYAEVSGRMRIAGEVSDVDELVCLRSVGGVLELHGTGVGEASLPALTRVGSLRVEGNPVLTRFSAESLVRARAATVVGNPVLTHVSMPVASLPDGLTLTDDRSLARLDLAVVEVGPLTVQDMPALVSLDGVDVVRAGDVVLADLPRLRSVDLTDLTLVTGSLIVRDVGASSLGGLVRLTRVEGDLQLRELGVTSLEGLEALSRVEGSIRIEDCPRLASLGGLTLADVPPLTLRATPSLTDLTALDGARSIGDVTDARFEVTP